MLSTHNTVPQLLQVAVMSITHLCNKTGSKLPGENENDYFFRSTVPVRGGIGADADLAGQSINIAS